MSNIISRSRKWIAIGFMLGAVLLSVFALYAFSLRVDGHTEDGTGASSLSSRMLPGCGTWQDFSNLSAISEVPQRGITIQGVAPVTPDDIWFLGVEHSSRRRERLRIFHWDGHSIKQHHVSDPEDGINLHSVAALSTTDIWAIASITSDGISDEISYHWDGLSWKRALIPVPDPEANLRGISALGSDNIWAVGWQSAGSTDNSIRPLVMHWSGGTWQVVPSPNLMYEYNMLYDVAALSPDEVWAIGNSQEAGIEGAAGRHPITMRWNGGTWDLIDSPAGWQRMSAISISPDKELWVVGTDAEDAPISASRNLSISNAAWQVIPMPEVGGYSILEHLVTRSSKDIWALGATWYDKSPDDGAAHAAALHYDGVVWEPKPFPTPLYTQSMFGVGASSTGELWAIGSYFEQQDDTPSYPLIAYLTDCSSQDK